LIRSFIAEKRIRKNYDIAPNSELIAKHKNSASSITTGGCRGTINYTYSSTQGCKLRFLISYSSSFIKFACDAREMISSLHLRSYLEISRAMALASVSFMKKRKKKKEKTKKKDK